jgi:hypothetical protein
MDGSFSEVKDLTNKGTTIIEKVMVWVGGLQPTGALRGVHPTDFGYGLGWWATAHPTKKMRFRHAKGKSDGN